MLNIIVVDTTAAARNRLVERLSALLKDSSAEQVFLPQLNIKQLSRQELKFHSKPDVCIIGDELISRELSEIAAIRKIFPEVVLLAVTSPQLENIHTIEQLARCGIDDTISTDISSAELLRKIILLARKAGAKKNGKLIVVTGGKGGVGVTTVAAGLSEALIEARQKVALIDFDFETQDLSRFLQVRPFINENLQLLFEQSRPVTQEFVQQCLIPVWHDEPLLSCMPPFAESEDLFDVRAGHARMLISILEVLDSIYDCTVVDVGSARGAFVNALYRTADQIVVVMNNDPACLFASLAKIERVRSCLAPNAELILVENSAVRSGLSDRLLRQEFSRAANIKADLWLSVALPFCRVGGRWPGMGATIYGQGNRRVKRALQELVRRVGVNSLNVSEGRAALVSLFELLGSIKSHRSKNLGTGTEISIPATPRNEAIVNLKKSTLGWLEQTEERGVLSAVDVKQEMAVEQTVTVEEDLLPSAMVSGVKGY